MTGQFPNLQHEPTCSSMSWSCMELPCESISMATSPKLLDSSCARSELSEGRRREKYRNKVRAHVFNITGQKCAIEER